MHKKTTNWGMLVVVVKWRHHATDLFILILIFLGQFCPKGERCNEVNPVWSTNPQNKARPLHWELRSLLVTTSVWVLWLFSCTLYNIWRCRRRGLWFIVLIWEDRNILPLQVSLQRQHVLLSVGLVWGLNPRPPARQSGALPTELTGWRCFLLSFTQREVSLYRFSLRGMTLSGCLS